MEFDHNNVRRRVVEEDRLSSLEDGLLHKILSCLDMKFAVQTCVLSSRWQFVWTSMPCLNFSSSKFDTKPKFASFVTHVLYHRNHQAQVSSVKLHFYGVVNQAFVRNIANYAFSRNVQELDICSFLNSNKPSGNFPPCLFSSQSLKHFRCKPCFNSACITPKTPWDFPALTTLHLSRIVLCSDVFSRCVNLEDLTLEEFVFIEAGEDFNIITPRLSNLMLSGGSCSRGINLIAPQLENLTINNCLFNRSLDLCFSDALPPQLSKDQFHSLNNVTVGLHAYDFFIPPFEKEDTRNTINVLQELRSARYLTLDAYVVECLSSFPDLLLHHPSPFSSLKCLTVIDFKRREKKAYQVKMSAQAINFLLGKSPSATFIMKSG